MTRSKGGAALDPDMVDNQHRKLLPDGYVIIDKLMPQESLILAHMDRLFMPHYPLSQAQVINITRHPPAQPPHIDDGFNPSPRPRPAPSAATVFAIDDFTAENGATLAIPRSHLWGEDRSPLPKDERFPAAMPAGSCILFLGNLWHGGSGNRTDCSRVALTAQYCEPRLRTRENHFCRCSGKLWLSCWRIVKRLLGYSIHPPFMGMVDGMHPKRKLPGQSFPGPDSAASQQASHRNGSEYPPKDIP
jgi:ectoine hydroxylase-related dioxygenase (phytanoyl-CoA dioxygenase family)